MEATAVNARRRRSRRAGNGAGYTGNYASHVAVEIVVREAGRLLACERLQIVRQHRLGRHVRAIDQDWQNSFLGGKRRSDLEPDIVSGIIEPSFALVVA